jgi:2-polyprenyl-3-methyl-5-hydroxy-6-metoxy-1,4-benzoquinol methylase
LLINNQDNLINHPDQIKWNEKYCKITNKEFLAHPILAVLENLRLGSGPILELACGLSGNVLSLASLGYNILAVDISEVALTLLANTIKEKCLEQKVNLLVADLSVWQPPKETFSLVLGLKYWDKQCFLNACQGVMKGGIIAWETFNKRHLCYHPHFRSEWCLDTQEPANLLASNFEILSEQDFDNGHIATRRLIAQRL